MTQDRLEALVLEAAETSCGLRLGTSEREEALSDIASVLFSRQADSKDAYGALGALIERRLGRAMGVAFDALGAPHDERAVVRFAREDVAKELSQGTFLPTLQPDDLGQSASQSVLFTNQAGAATLSFGAGVEGTAQPDGEGAPGPQTLALSTGDGVQGRVGQSLTVVTIGRALGELEQALLDSQPTAKREDLGHGARGQDLVGEVLDGKYRVDDFLGKGGFGSVYKGCELSTGADVAIKVMHPAVAMRNRGNLNFTAEAQRLTKLTHPGVVQWKTYSPKEDDLSYLVMEFVDGQELSRLLEDKRRLEVDEAAPILLQILDALRAAHHLPGGEVMLHLDLKPGNVLLAKGADGAPPQVKLIDFGIGQYSGEESLEPVAGGGLGSGTAERTASFGMEAGPGMGATSVRRAAGGTALYASPEQCKHLRRDRSIAELDARSDLYSFGVLAYKVLSGEYPYSEFSGIEDSLRSGLSRREAYLEAFRIHIDEPHRPLRQLAPQVDRSVASLVERCLAKDPQERFGSTQEAYDAFHAALVPKPRTLGLVAAGVLGLALVGVTWAFVRGGRVAGAEVSAVQVERVAGQPRQLVDLPRDRALVASPGGGPRFLVGESGQAAWDLDDLRLVRVQDGVLGDDLAGVQFVPDSEPGAFRLLRAEGSPTQEPQEVKLVWAGGNEVSAPFTLELVDRFQWGAEPQAMELLVGGNGRAGASLLDGRSLGLHVGPGTRARIRLELGALRRQVLPDGLELLLGGEALPFAGVKGSTAFEAHLKADQLLTDSGAGDALALGFRARAIDGAVYDLPWTASVLPITELARPEQLRLDLVDQASGQVLQSARALAGGEGSEPLAFQLVRRQRFAERADETLALRLTATVAPNGLPYGLALFEGGQELAQSAGSNAQPSPLQWSLPQAQAVGAEASDASGAWTLNLELRLDQSDSVLGAQPKRVRRFELLYDPVPVRFTASLSQDASEGPLRALDAEASGAAAPAPLALLPSAATVELRGKGDTLAVVECRSGAAVHTSYRHGDGELLSLAVPIQVDPEAPDRKVLVGVRVWSAHEFDDAQDMQRLLTELVHHEPSEPWTPPVGFEQPHSAFERIVEAANELGLQARLADLGQRLVPGAAAEPEPVPLADLRVLLEAEESSGSVRMEGRFEGSAQNVLEPGEQPGTFSFRAPEGWDETAPEGPRRALYVRVFDDLREAQPFRVNLAFSSRGPSIKAVKPLPESPWEMNARGQLVAEVQLEDSNGVKEAWGTLRLPDGEVAQLSFSRSKGDYWQAMIPAEERWSSLEGTLEVQARDLAGVSSERRELPFVMGRIDPYYDPRVSALVAPAEGDESGPVRTTEMLLFQVPKGLDYLFRELPTDVIPKSALQLQEAGVEWFQGTQNLEEYGEQQRRSGSVSSVLLSMDRDRSYYLDRNEVSVDDYRAYLRSVGPGYGQGIGWAGGSPPPARGGWESALAYFDGRPGDEPVVELCLYEALAYAHWAGKRLPTWFEWEFAVRGGAQGNRAFALEQPFGGGATAPYFAWIDADQLRPVQEPGAPASPEGLLHLCGNASEWTCTALGRRLSQNPAKQLLDSLDLGPSTTLGSRMNFATVGGSISHTGQRPFHDYLTVRLMKPHQVGCGRDSQGRPEGTDPLVGFRCAIDADLVRTKLNQSSRSESSSKTAVSWKRLPN